MQNPPKSGPKGSWTAARGDQRDAPEGADPSENAAPGGEASSGPAPAATPLPYSHPPQA
jgi:hypothetical protein